MRLSVLYFFLLCVLSIAHAKKVELVVDTDAGIDDIIAITYLIKDPNISMKAITIETDGITHQKQAVKNIHALLAMLNHSHIPVACGQNHPVSGPSNRFPPVIMDINDTLAQTPIPSETPYIPPCRSAEELLISVLDKTQQPISILAIGPLTNIAKTLEKRPDLDRKIDALYIMGGAIKVHGNIDDVLSNANSTAEWNIYQDAVAAERVFHSKIKIVLVPLDVTKQLPLDSGFDKLLKPSKSKAAQFIYNLLLNNRKMQPPGVWFFWDPLAAVIVLHPEIATLTTLNLSIQLTNKVQLGATYIDNKKGAAINVVTSVNKKKFKSILSEGLTRNSI